MSLREQLRGRAQPTETVRLPVDPAGYARRERELAAATWELEQARATGGVDTARLRARVHAAQVAVDESPCIEVVLRALPPPEWEALVDLHPPMAEQQERGMQWNPATFRPALLAACVVPPDGEKALTAEEWEQVVKAGELGSGEYNTLCNAAVQLNLRAPASAVGKGR